MSWKCPQCGFENAKEIRACAGGCGHLLIPERLMLTAVATGKELRMRITTPVGRRLLATIAGEEAVFASEPQFEVVKDESVGAWMIRSNTSAKNPTLYNGSPIGPEGVAVTTGGVVTIGRERAKLTVTLEM